MNQRDLDGFVSEISEIVKAKLLEKGLNFQPVSASSHSYAPVHRTGQSAMIKAGAVRIGTNASTTESQKSDPSMAKKIDHTLLKADATREELDKLIDEAIKYDFATVCVNSTNIEYVAQRLRGTSVLPIAVVGFPLGAAMSSSKAFETKEAVALGALEIDMVINIGAMKDKDYLHVYEDILAVKQAAGLIPVKVILETALLTHDEKVIGCVLSKVAGCEFVKTSTGFGPGGATEEDIALMRAIVGEDMGVKASGGIRSYEDASKMVQAGASRVGASASVAIVTKKNGAQKKKTSSYLGYRGKKSGTGTKSSIPY